MEDDAQEPKESTPVREVLGGAVGALIAIGCILPPLVHIVTGPFGPLIAGFVVSNHVQPKERGRAVIPITLGVTLASIVGVVALIIRGSASGPPPSWFPSSSALGLVLGGVWAWSTAFAAAGVAISAAAARKRAPSEQDRPATEQAQPDAHAQAVSEQARPESAHASGQGPQ